MRHPLTVDDVMTRDVITVPADAPFKAVAELFVEHKVSAFPVTQEGVGLVGIVSETDLLHKQEHPESRHRGLAPGQRLARRKARAVTARDLMTSPMVTIEVGSTLSEAARLMAAREITRLVVLDGEWMAGIVTRSDLLRAFLDSDRVLLARVRREAIEHSLWDDPFGVEIKVVDGVVTLTGQLPHRSMIPVAEQAIREVDGVVGVVNRLSYAFDDTARVPGPFY
ncbi:CBS domain-containing protein [Kribbella ginsengisoli]|uniref:CBS domain-containing protein n=1 Tax=Kribbella ginsengisoli TaxID=363865 RepID=A0ABP6Z1M3_9ACTN